MNKFLESRGEIRHVPISPYYSKFQRTTSVVDGVLCSQSFSVEYSAIEDVYSSEFSLGNLIAIGADKGLTYMSMSVNSDMNFVDNFAKSYQNITQDVNV